VKPHVALAIVVLLAVAGEPATAQVLLYDNSPRIIRVPQGNVRAAAPADPVVIDDDDNVELSVERIEPPKPRRKPAKPVPRVQSELPPPPSGPKRAVLSAPPPMAEGPTPVRPTPRWRNADKFEAPPAVTDSNGNPPAGADSAPH
jgi:hypothetical protein